VATWTNIFTLSAKPGDKGWYYEVHNVPHGTVAHVWYDSPTLNSQRRMTVYTPAGYESNKERGLGIVGVSLDRDKDSWVTAIKKLQLPWPQMSDLKYWDNEVAKTFNITSIPHTIVVDQKGKILRRGLRGEQLKEFVESELAK
jgi:hypothetical protein